MFTKTIVTTSAARQQALPQRSLWRTTGPTTARSEGDQAPTLLTVHQACGALNISRWTLYQLIRKRQLASVKIGRRRLIPATELIRFVERLRGEEYF